MGPPPEVAEVRRAVRRRLEEFAAGDLVLAACSGGADSLALAAALAHEGPGSGGRSPAGTPERRGACRRRLLGVGGAALRAACPALGLQRWDDPQNADPSYARARVRHQALPAREAALGPGVAEALARSARQF